MIVEVPKHSNWYKFYSYAFSNYEILLIKYNVVNDIFFQLIKMLTDKCRNQEALIAEFDSREQEYQELDAEIDFLKQQVESQR